MSCGCKIDDVSEKGYKRFKPIIKYCALHAAAPKLLKKLQQFHAYMPDIDRANIEDLIAAASGASK